MKHLYCDEDCILTLCGQDDKDDTEYVDEEIGHTQCEACLMIFQKLEKQGGE